jgi:hypothetical protein
MTKLSVFLQHGVIAITFYTPKGGVKLSVKGADSTSKKKICQQLL